MRCQATRRAWAHRRDDFHPRRCLWQSAERLREGWGPGDDGGIPARSLQLDSFGTSVAALIPSPPLSPTLPSLWRRGRRCTCWSRGTRTSGRRRCGATASTPASTRAAPWPTSSRSSGCPSTSAPPSSPCEAPPPPRPYVPCVQKSESLPCPYVAPCLDIKGELEMW